MDVQNQSNSRSKKKRVSGYFREITAEISTIGEKGKKKRKRNNKDRKAQQVGMLIHNQRFN